MSASHGQFVWFELMTQDVAAATDFYRAVIGWDADDDRFATVVLGDARCTSLPRS